jgi:hypothetical protein
MAFVSFQFAADEEMFARTTLFHAGEAGNNARIPILVDGQFMWLRLRMRRGFPGASSRLVSAPPARSRNGL